MHRLLWYTCVYYLSQPVLGELVIYMCLLPVPACPGRACDIHVFITCPSLSWESLWYTCVYYLSQPVLGELVIVIYMCLLPVPACPGRACYCDIHVFITCPSLSWESLLLWYTCVYYLPQPVLGELVTCVYYLPQPVLGELVIVIYMCLLPAPACPGRACYMCLLPAPACPGRACYCDIHVFITCPSLSWESLLLWYTCVYYLSQPVLGELVNITIKLITDNTTPSKITVS